MQEKKAYGQLSADEYSIGDIVEWKRWDNKHEIWDSHYGVITEIKNKFMSNRLVCICTVLPIEGNLEEKDFFSMSLKLVSRASENSLGTNC